MEEGREEVIDVHVEEGTREKDLSCPRLEMTREMKIRGRKRNRTKQLL